jgi:hypothetical protein
MAVEHDAMSYRFAEMVGALCLGLALALAGWWEIAEPVWRAAGSGPAREWLEIASASLLGCAILIGGAGALYEILRGS